MKHQKLVLSFVVLLYSSLFSLRAQCAHPDYDALITIYNALGGSQWNNTKGWKDGINGTNCDPCNGWAGIGCSNGRVSSFVLLGDSKAQGTIPEAIGDLDQLTILVLRSATIVGEIPKTIGNLTKLNLLNFADCNITGSIPNEIDNLKRVTTLNLSNTKISGPIPNQIGGMTNLIVLLLNNTNLSGSIPSELSKIFRLRKIDISYAQLSGTIPEEIGDINFLAEFIIHHNALSGVVPTSIVRLVNLKIMALNHNKISNPLPKEIFGLRNLTQLYLNDNDIKGQLPLDISFSDSLKVLDISNNQIVGTLPSNLFSKSNIQSINLSNNQLSGSIKIKDNNAINLKTLDLQNNKLSGPIPSNLPDLASITTINVNNNRLIGCVPTSYTKTCQPIDRINIKSGQNELIKINADLSQNPKLPFAGNLVPMCSGKLFDNQLNLTCDDGFVVTKDDQMNNDCRCIGKLDTCFFIIRDTFNQLVIDSMITTQTFTGAVTDTLFVDLTINGKNKLSFRCFTEQWGAFLVIETINPTDVIGYTYEILTDDGRILIYDQLQGVPIRQNLDFLEGKGAYTINFRDSNENIATSKKLILL